MLYQLIHETSSLKEPNNYRLQYPIVAHIYYPLNKVFKATVEPGEF